MESKSLFCFTKDESSQLLSGRYAAAMPSSSMSFGGRETSSISTNLSDPLVKGDVSDDPWAQMTISLVPRHQARKWDEPHAHSLIKEHVTHHNTTSAEPGNSTGS